MERSSGHYSTFIVRIWNEAEGKIRGHIQHTGTQEHTYFDNPADMDQFILKHLTQINCNQSQNSKGKSQSMN